MSTTTPSSVSAHLQDLAAFVQASPSSFHAAEEVARRLEAVGFTRVDESADFPSTPGGHVLVREGAVVAWILPERAPAENDAGPAGVPASGVPVFRVLGAHTDSPGFKLKPQHRGVTADGWVQAGVEVYGGPLLNSWLDRELRFAGRLVLADGRTVLAATGPVGRIPQLAVHLDRTVNAEGLTLQRQRHTQPIVAAEPRPGEGDSEAEGACGAEGDTGGGTVVRMSGDVIDLLAAEAGVDPTQVRGADVVVADAQAPGTFGANGEFFASGRLDNLSSVHAGLVAMEALAGEGGAVVSDAVLGEAAGAPVIPVLAAFDHEEVGSDTRTGAGGPLLEEVMARVLDVLGVRGQAVARSRAGSWLLSADAGHLVHPNYTERHDPANHPRVNAGPLLKINANQRYATDAVGEAAFTRWCEAAGVPFQRFVSNNDVPCGSTIGPISATRLGVRTVDVGIGLLSMHSAREMCGAQDPGHLAAVAEAFFRGV
ncbi:M18 family aminopeptidase [Micrococcus sp.]|uniref:M18 family aminopeptidase n=1 Tax=Micrococcus sp. TaxID=1271 RepID=UPI002A91CB9A|nr:M18 family aminopeptidase [Micrococcus sp.]MDY6054547.1 M18 family aminopeptidase [Micrococcus sp.]